VIGLLFVDTCDFISKVEMSKNAGEEADVPIPFP
jgi:hypothetical protein